MAATPAAAGHENARPDLTARERLAALAQQAGYGRDVLAAIADAALHPRQPAAGEKADDTQLHEIIVAVDVLITAGRTGTQVLGRLAESRAAAGDWRNEFWRTELAEANRNHNAQHPPTSPTRGQRRRPRADATARPETP